MRCRNPPRRRVFHCDDRLVGKAANQLDLPLGERLDSGTRDCHRADQLALSQQRHSETRSNLAECYRFGMRVFGHIALLRKTDD